LVVNIVVLWHNCIWMRRWAFCAPMATK
jgi:hypothetical protein